MTIGARVLMASCLVAVGLHTTVFEAVIRLLGVSVQDPRVQRPDLVVTQSTSVARRGG